MTLTFNELRRIKDSLPNGSMRRIAKELGVSAETVRNYFGGANFDQGTLQQDFILNLDQMAVSSRLDDPQDI